MGLVVLFDRLDQIRGDGAVELTELFDLLPQHGQKRIDFQAVVTVVLHDLHHRLEGILPRLLHHPSPGQTLKKDLDPTVGHMDLAHDVPDHPGMIDGIVLTLPFMFRPGRRDEEQRVVFHRHGRRVDIRLGAEKNRADHKGVEEEFIFRHHRKYRRKFIIIAELHC